MSHDGRSVIAKFRALYGEEPLLFSAPGRVNLIGEHTDYNEGFVLPMAIERRTWIGGRTRPDRRIRVHSLDFAEEGELDLNERGRARRGGWSDYIEGMARALDERCGGLQGADLVIGSEIPIGAGLSSSAALEVGVGFALAQLNDHEIGKEELARIGQWVEHEYVGNLCGIMDQLTVALGRAGHAMLIDCRSLEVRYIPFRIERAAVVICDTGVKHELAGTEYNLRRAECERGVELLRRHLPGVHALRDVGMDEFRRYEARLPEPIRRRCRHVVAENARTLAAAAALERGEVEAFGHLMNLSHDSLRDDYEVSCEELDLMVEIARAHDGVWGARMTGGGFGGSTVVLVRGDAVADFSAYVRAEYERRTGRAARVYLVEASDGVRREAL